MNARIIVLSLLFTTCCGYAQGQKQHVVVDGDTGKPIANVSVMGKDFTAVTDSLGRFTLDKRCKTLVFSHINYVSYIANINDLGDSIILYTNDKRLDEVMVFGKPTAKDPLENLNSRLRLDKTDAQLISANPNGNLVGLLYYLIPKKWRKSKKEKRKEQLQKVLEEY